MKRIIVLFFILQSFLASKIVAAENDPVKIVASLMNEIRPHLEYSDEEYKLMDKDLQDWLPKYYKSEVEPIINNFPTRIMPTYNFVDIDDDGKDELIFWSEGFWPSADGNKEFIAVAKQNKEGKFEIVAFSNIEEVGVSCSKVKKCSYLYSRFTKHPKTSNHYIGGALTYANYGASGHSYSVKIIGYNRYEHVFYIDTVKSSLPLIPDPNYPN